MNYSGNVLFKTSRILGVKGKFKHVKLSILIQLKVWSLVLGRENMKDNFHGTPAGQIIMLEQCEQYVIF